jgi:amino acid adenylation domain-containing protein
VARLLPDLLRDAARRSPDHPAVVFNEAGLTYGELEILSNRLARRLADAGLRHGDRVALYLDGSPDAVVAVFGVLKAGCCYVPLDPSAPIARLSYILGNSNARAIIATLARRERVERLAESAMALQAVAFIDGGEQVKVAGRQVIDWPSVLEAPAEPFASGAEPGDCAYILYTSGSTGEPKGVMISHRNALAFIDWAQAAFVLSPSDHVSGHAPLHFDLSVFDVFATIKAGATLYPVPRDVARFPFPLAQFIAEQQISVWYSVPSVLTLLLRGGKLEQLNLSHLRAVLLAGEVFAPKYLRALMEKLPRARYYNLYGPTETNVVTRHEVTRLPSEDEDIPIGRAYEGTEVFALDETGAIVTEPGVLGELYVHGPTVALGYCNDVEKTSSLFPTLGLPSGGTGRVYRTGDLVYLDSQGDYHFAGRRDHQVKLHGYRIELGEVEAALLRYGGVHEAVVLMHTREPQAAYLKAFVAIRRGDAVTEEQLKRHCFSLLPPYMVPESIEFLDALPRTSTGKVDRVALTGRL